MSRIICWGKFMLSIRKNPQKSGQALTQALLWAAQGVVASPSLGVFQHCGHGGLGLGILGVFSNSHSSMIPVSLMVL